MHPVDGAINVVIVGCGKITSGLDSPGDGFINTHIKALLNNPGFKIDCVFDQDYEAAKNAGLKWGVPFSTDISELAGKKIDLAVIAVNTEQHFSVFKKIAECARKILIEKPISASLSDSEQIMSICRQNEIDLYVNYSRSFAPEINKMVQALRLSKYGNFQKGFLTYTKGFNHNASHYLFILASVFTDISVDRIIDITDHGAYVDADLILKVNNKQKIYCFALNEDCYSYLSLELYYDKAKITLSDFGFSLEEYPVKSTPYFEGYKELESTPVVIDTGTRHQYMKHVYDWIYNDFSTGSYNFNISDALKIEALMDLKSYMHVPG
jgi:predicted dehydrogenase